MSKLQEALERGEFAVTAEMAPPKGTDLSHLIECAKLCVGRVHAANVTDFQSAVMRATSLATCKLLKDVGLEPVIQITGRDRNRIAIEGEMLSADEVNSFTYYTFAELVLIILYISTMTSISMYKERFLHTMTRLKVSNIKRINILLSKIALGIVVGILQIIIVYIISTRFLKVDWGDNLLYIFMVLISLVIFSSVLGIFMSMIFHDAKTCYTANNILIIIMGFLGGSYVPMCLVKSVRVTNFICEIIPSYWANISLLSLSYDVKTNYYIISIFISLGLSVVMLVVGSLISKLKVGGSFD